MKLSWTKLGLLLVIAAAFVVPVAAWAGSDDPANGSCPGHGKNMEQKITAEADRVTETLSLTPAQRTLFVDMKTAEFKFHGLKHAAAKTDSAATTDVSAAGAAAEKAKDAFLASLNPTQKPQWEALRAESKGKMKHKCDHPDNATEPPAQPAE